MNNDIFNIKIVYTKGSCNGIKSKQWQTKWPINERDRHEQKTRVDGSYEILTAVDKSGVAGLTNTSSPVGLLVLSSGDLIIWVSSAPK